MKKAFHNERCLHSTVRYKHGVKSKIAHRTGGSKQEAS
jgi:hypothetical protein